MISYKSQCNPMITTSRTTMMMIIMMISSRSPAVPEQGGALLDNVSPQPPILTPSRRERTPRPSGVPKQLGSLRAETLLAPS